MSAFLLLESAVFRGSPSPLRLQGRGQGPRSRGRMHWVGSCPLPQGPPVASWRAASYTSSTLPALFLRQEGIGV